MMAYGEIDEEYLLEEGDNETYADSVVPFPPSLV